MLHPGVYRSLLAEQNLGKRLHRVSLGERYLQGASMPYLMENYGIGASALVNAVEALAGRTLGFTEDRIVHSAASDFVGENQMEAL